MRPVTSLDQPRAIGAALVSSKARAGQSHIDKLRQSGALKLLFPRSSGTLEAVLINTAGGITGGDVYSIDAQAGAGSELRVTTQAAERAYRAQPGQTGTMTTKLSVSNDASLQWLPQETILFEGAALTRRLDVDLDESARFLMVEPVLFGRRAMGEDLHDLRFDDRVDIRRNGTPIYRDGVRLLGDVAAQLDRPAVAAGARAMANLVYVAPDAAALLTELRGLIGTAGGVSLLNDTVLVARILAPDGFTLRRSLLPALDRLTTNRLPPSWRL